MRGIVACSFLVIAMAAGCSGCPGKPRTLPASSTGGQVFLVRDNGKRCFAPPCPSWTATETSRREEREITGIDLSMLSAKEAKRPGLRERVLSGELRVRGEIRTVPDAGPAGDARVLFVTELLDPEEAAEP